MSLPRLLLIDDDLELCDSLRRVLQMDGFDVTATHTSPDGLRLATSGRYDLLILDHMLPGGDGRSLLRTFRANAETPVIMLTARGSEADRIAGFDAGADDYLPKPFSVRELTARIRAVLKRRQPKSTASTITSIGDLELRLTNRTVTRLGQPIPLTGAEYEVLLLLLRSPGKIITRETIAETCLGRPVGVFDRSVDNHISNLRKKLGPLPDSSERIRSIRGAGYIYCLPDANGATQP